MTLERPGVLRSGLLLAAIATAGVALLAGVHTLTRDRIAEQEARVVRERLAQVLGARRCCRIRDLQRGPTQCERLCLR
jgi:Na+-translocating ferredoxin:NAD+ oxidoreductase RnfG subunit